MNSSPQFPRAKRNLRALLILGFVLAIVPSLGGGLILAVAHSRESITQPLWQFGQYAMIIGLLNLLIYLSIYFQLRRVFVESSDDVAA